MKLGLVVILLLSSGVSRAGAAADSLVHTTPEGIVLTVTADGLSSIMVGDRQLAVGGMYAWNASQWFGAASGPIAFSWYCHDFAPKLAAQVKEKSIEILGPDHARVRQAGGDVTTTFDYQFTGEDLSVTARIENNHPTDAIPVPALGGLKFTFAKAPEGMLPYWHMSYTQAHGIGLMHPSHAIRIGGSYGIDGQVGVGLSPQRAAWEYTMFFWDVDDWNKLRDKGPGRWLNYLTARPIPAGGALTIGFTLRVSRQQTWEHLLQPYKDYFLSAYGPLRYKPDHRWVVMANVNRSVADIGPTNPYGLHPDFRRLDLPDMAKKFGDIVLPALKDHHGQGVLIWGHTGENPHGAMYRADFDVIPPEIDENLVTLAKRFNDEKVQFGVATRPGEMAIHGTWKEDWTVAVNPDDPQQLDIMWGRFKHMIDKGCTIFYLDSFGNSLEHARIMRYLREKMGPNIGTYVEQQCDVTLPFSGIYTETDFWAKGSADWVSESGYSPRVGLDNLRIYRWLLGDVGVVTRLYDVHGKIPDGFEDATTFFYKNHMTPLIPDFMAPKSGIDAEKVQMQYVTDAGASKE